MTLFVSDLHLGRGTAAETASAERDARALLDAHAAALCDGGTLVLLGDVFDQFLEYRHLVPKTGLRLTAALADLADGGARVLYAVGNRDPWHLPGGLFQDLGVEVLRGGALLELEGRRVWVEHGDAYDPGRRRASRGGRWAPAAHRLLRRPAVARAFRNALPADGAYALTRAVAARFGTDGTPDPAVAAALQAEALVRLRTTDAEIVVHGHSHAAARADGAAGTYLNPGYWFGARAYARLDPPRPGGADGPALLRWTGPLS